MTTTPAKKTAPAAQKPAQTESAASVASRVAPLNLAALAPRPSKVPEVRRTVSDRDNSVVEGWIKTLETERAGKDVSPAARDLPIKLGQLGELRTRLNEAGAKLKAGVAIRLLNASGEELNIPDTLKALKDGKASPKADYTLKFWTQKRRQTKKTQVAQGAAQVAAGQDGESAAK